MWKTWVQSLGWEDPLEKGMATHSSIVACLENSMDCIVHGVAKSWTGLSDFHFHMTLYNIPYASHVYSLSLSPYLSGKLSFTSLMWLTHG